MAASFEKGRVIDPSRGLVTRSRLERLDKSECLERKSRLTEPFSRQIAIKSHTRRSLLLPFETSFSFSLFIYYIRIFFVNFI